MRSDKRYQSFDLLRFFLAVLILLHHFQQMTRIGMGVFKFYGGMINFAYCVEFFFILSGFLSARKKDQILVRKLHEYLLHKLKRLYPVSALSMIVMLCIYVAYYLVHGSWLTGLVPDVYKLFNSFLFTFSGGAVLCGRSLNSPLWYICVLLICYVLLWLISYLSKGRKDGLVYLSIALCLFGVAVHSYEFDLPFMNEVSSRGYSAFFFGVLLSHAYDIFNIEKLARTSYLVFFICFVLAIIDYPSFYHYEWGALTFVVFPCIVFICLDLEKYLKHGSRLIKMLSGASFEIYVWHMVFITLLQFLMSFDAIRELVLSINEFLFMAFFAAAVCAFSIFMYVKAEKRINEFTYRFFSGFLKKDVEREGVHGED